MNLINPESVYEKLDAIANFVAQIRIAKMTRDEIHEAHCLCEIERLTANAMAQLEESK